MKIGLIIIRIIGNNEGNGIYLVIKNSSNNSNSSSGNSSSNSN